ncbi:hypothetical protein LXL04_005114 [Taraxacum kok-saghyz]
MSDKEGDGGDTRSAPVKLKEVGTTTVACPMLNPTNYTVWALRMKVLLRIHKAWTIIDRGEEENDGKNNLAMGLLYQAIPESLIMQIGDVDESKTLWESIKSRYVGADRVKEARLQTLNTEFDRLRMNETESIDSFSGKLSEIALDGVNWTIRLYLIYGQDSFVEDNNMVTNENGGEHEESVILNKMEEDDLRDDSHTESHMEEDAKPQAVHSDPQCCFDPVASKSASLGETIDESKLVKVVPRRFIHLVASLEQVLDLKSVGFEDVVGRLKAYEERIRDDEDGDEQQKVLMARSGGDGSSSGGGGSRSSSGGMTGSGGTKGSRFNCEGGRNRSASFNRDGSGGSGSKPAQTFNRPNNQKQPNFDDQPNSNKKCNCDCCEKNRRNPNKDRSKIVCYRCDKPGHYASECPERP